MKYKTGEKVVLNGKGISKQSTMFEEVGKPLEIFEVDYSREMYWLDGGLRVNEDMINHDKTAELKKGKLLNHYTSELEKRVTEVTTAEGARTDETKRMKSKFERHKELTDYMHNTYVSKNKDYGDSFSRVHREIGWQSSLGDIAHKFYRLQNLMQNKGERKVDDETVIDTAIDMANYLTMLVMELEEEE